MVSIFSVGIMYADEMCYNKWMPVKSHFWVCGLAPAHNVSVQLSHHQS